MPVEKVLLASPRGFCAGVDRAIIIVEQALEKFGAPIYVRHEVVHNKFVVDGLRRAGAVFVDELDEVPDDAIVIEVSGNAAVIKGDYKLTRNQLPHGDARWRLYDLSKDPGETTDLSASRPEIYDDLSAEYAAYSKRVGVLEVPEGYNSLDEVTRHSLARQEERYRPYLIGAGIALLVLIAGGALLWSRRKQKA